MASESSEKGTARWAPTSYQEAPCRASLEPTHLPWAPSTGLTQPISAAKTAGRAAARILEARGAGEGWAAHGRGSVGPQRARAGDGRHSGSGDAKRNTHCSSDLVRTNLRGDVGVVILCSLLVAFQLLHGDEAQSARKPRATPSLQEPLRGEPRSPRTQGNPSRKQADVSRTDVHRPMAGQRLQLHRALTRKPQGGRGHLSRQGHHRAAPGTGPPTSSSASSSSSNWKRETEGQYLWGHRRSGWTARGTVGRAVSRVSQQRKTSSWRALSEGENRESHPLHPACTLPRSSLLRGLASQHVLGSDT